MNLKKICKIQSQNISSRPQAASDEAVVLVTVTTCYPAQLTARRPARPLGLSIQRRNIFLNICSRPCEHQYLNLCKLFFPLRYIDLDDTVYSNELFDANNFSSDMTFIHVGSSPFNVPAATDIL